MLTIGRYGYLLPSSRTGESIATIDGATADACESPKDSEHRREFLNLGQTGLQVFRETAPEQPPLCEWPTRSRGPNLNFKFQL